MACSRRSMTLSGSIGCRNGLSPPAAATSTGRAAAGSSSRRWPRRHGGSPRLRDATARLPGLLAHHALSARPVSWRGAAGHVQDPADLRAVGLRRPDRAVAPARPDSSSASGRPAGGRRRLSLLDPGGLELRVPEQALHRASAAHLFAGHRLSDLSDPGSRRASTDCGHPVGLLHPDHHWLPARGPRRLALAQRRGARARFRCLHRVRRRPARPDPPWPRQAKALHLRTVGRDLRLHALLRGLAGGKPLALEAAGLSRHDRHGAVRAARPHAFLMLLLMVPYLIFLAGAKPGGRPSATRLVGALAASAVLVGLAIVLG